MRSWTAAISLLGRVVSTVKRDRARRRRALNSREQHQTRRGAWYRTARPRVPFENPSGDDAQRRDANASRTRARSDLSPRTLITGCAHGSIHVAPVAPLGRRCRRGGSSPLRGTSTRRSAPYSRIQWVSDGATL